MTQTQQFIATTVGGAIALVAGFLCFTNPPILNLPEWLAIGLIVAGMVSFGVQVRTGYTATTLKDDIAEAFRNAE